MKFLGPLQLRIMQVIWYADEDYMKGRALMEILNKNQNEPKLAYTTVNTVLTSLCKFGFTQRVMLKGSYTYVARMREDQYEVKIFEYCADIFHNGSMTEFVRQVDHYARPGIQ